MGRYLKILEIVGEEIKADFHRTNGYEYNYETCYTKEEQDFRLAFLTKDRLTNESWKLKIDESWKRLASAMKTSEWKTERQKLDQEKKKLIGDIKNKKLKTAEEVEDRRVQKELLGRYMSDRQFDEMYEKRDGVWMISDKEFQKRLNQREDYKRQEEQEDEEIVDMLSEIVKNAPIEIGEHEVTPEQYKEIKTLVNHLNISEEEALQLLLEQQEIEILMKYSNLSKEEATAKVKSKNK